MSATHIASVTGANTAALSASQIGDFLIGFASRDGSSTAPVIPADWTQIVSGGTNSLGYALAYKRATSTNESVGTWINASSLIVSQYRPAPGYEISIGAVLPAGSASTLTANFPALSLQNSSGSSWLLAFMAHRSPDIAPISSPPAGLTHRASVQDSVDSAAAFDSAGPVSSWIGQTVTYTGTSDACRSIVAELRVSQVQLSRFYFRSNDAGGGVRYFRTNDASGLQTVTVSGLIKDHTSLAFNLPFNAVDGDRVTVPTAVAGSTLTVQQNGRYVFSPAVPNGTQFTRTWLDVSTGQTYSETVTVYQSGGNHAAILSAAFVASTGTSGTQAGGDTLITSVASVTAAGTAGTQSSGDVLITSTATVDATGFKTEQLSGDVVITAAANVIATGTSTESSSGNVVIDSVATVESTGSSQITISGDVVISVTATVTAEGESADAFNDSVVITATSVVVAVGSVGDAVMVPPTNRIFIFD